MVAVTAAKTGADIDVDVLVVGAGPVGLTAAVELARRDVSCRVIDRLPERLPYAKAVGIQPRTLEVWESMGVVREALDAAEPFLGQKLYVNGREVSTIRLGLPPDVPYGFAALPQYEVERILSDHLAGLGVHVEREARLVSFEQDAEHVRAVVAHAVGESDEQIRARYLVGCDGAHSTVRKGLGLGFEGDAFPESYMLGDVEVDWSLPRGYAIRSMHQTDGKTDDLLVCIPLPGHKRYRISMLLPADQEDGNGATVESGAGDDVVHGLQSGGAPSLADLQTVLDRLAPEPVTADNLRWSSVFRISHRLVDRYRVGRVFVAGDAAHIHPPTGAQGMNTGIQDAHNLAWKLALAVSGEAAPGLLDSYEAERLPVAEEVVGRTVRHARAGIEADPEDPATVIRREAQLLVGYPDSPIVGPGDSGPGHGAADAAQPGWRAPDCRDLHSPIATYPIRLFDLLHGTGHTLLLYADGASSATTIFPRLADLAAEHAVGRLDTYTVVPGEFEPAGDGVLPPVVHDAAGRFRAAYAPKGMEAFLIRPDGYLGTRVPVTEEGALVEYLDRIFAGV